MMQLNNRRFTIRITILTTFFIVCGLVAIVSIALHYYFGMKAVRAHAEEHFYQVAERTSEKALELEKTGISYAYALKNSPVQAESLSATNIPTIGLDMVELLRDTKGIFSLYIGYPNGDYLEVSNLEASDNLRSVWRAAPNDRWVMVKIHDSQNQRLRITQFLDDELNVRYQTREATQYFATDRPWFTSATTERVNKRPPYLFQFVQQTGTSYSIRTEQGAVVGSTTLTSSLDELLRVSRFPQTSQSFIFDSSGQITAFHADNTSATGKGYRKPVLTPQEWEYLKRLPVLQVANMKDYPPFEYTVSGNPRGYSVELIKLLAKRLDLKLNFVNGYSFTELTELFYQGKVDIMLSMMRTAKRESVGSFSEPIVHPEIIAVTHKQVAKSVTSTDDLIGLRIAVQRGYAITQYLKQRLPNEHYIETQDTLSALKLLEQGHVDVVLDHKVVIEYIEQYFFLKNIKYHDSFSSAFNQTIFSLHLLAQQEYQPLIDILNKTFKQLEPDAKSQLAKKWLNLSSSPVPEIDQLTVGRLPSEELLKRALNENNRGRTFYLTIGDKEYLAFVDKIKGYSDTNRHDFIGLLVERMEAEKSFKNDLWYAISITVIVLMMLVPVVLWSVSAIVKPINMLALENLKIRSRQYDKVRHIPTSIREIHQLSRSLVELSESICSYERSQKELMDSFIRLMAEAIDQKSPYTGGHCERVPKLAIMLAEAACKSNIGELKGFDFASPEEWREFKVAAWLHDCGKITTPEHIVDKGSKLEAIYNRIHEIRMRFEVLWRDAEIRYHEQVQENPHQQQQYHQELEANLDQLKQDFAFVATCNVGGEFLDESAIARLRTIGKRTWVRHFNDRLGLSPAEEARLEKIPAQETPYVEQLLTDKVEHLVDWEDQDKHINSDRFNLKPERFKQNLGELYNLSVSRGTLTAEDRYIINEHIVATINMLENLPLPDELSQVPEYAGGHHEKINGKGFPLGLAGSDLSIPAKIMAVADIFEALTASDRPYKKAKTLSQSLYIMRNMALDDHIDQNLFRMFIESRTYMLYAEQFLSEEQIDAIDEESILSGLS